MTSAAEGTDRTDKMAHTSPVGAKDDPFLQPWQFFLLGGMLAATATVIVATGQSPANIIILSLTVVSVSFVGLGAYRILSPLVNDQPDAPLTIAGRTRIALEREKALVLRSIKELEFDFAMGKIAKADFDEMSARLRSRALGLMRQLDAGGGYREQIQKEVQERLARLGVEGDRFSHRLGNAGEATAEAVALHNCAECETANDPDARFCKNCGHRLSTDSR
ncbi:MAG TPA: zinc ribbon domain-containing protein [Vicinamibacterales bacterium]|nr:zinc ribbon domain-containing protein [Vicinamibacterales bacterium]